MSKIPFLCSFLTLHPSHSSLVFLFTYDVVLLGERHNTMLRKNIVLSYVFSKIIFKVIIPKAAATLLP